MSVVITNYEMPECCDVCLFGCWSNLHQTCSCKLKGYESGFQDFSTDYRTRRSDICPLEEQKKGEWIERNPQNSDTCRLIECDQCGFSHIVGFNVPYEHWIENRNFCERCGADMRMGR